MEPSLSLRHRQLRRFERRRAKPLLNSSPTLSLVAQLDGALWAKSEHDRAEAPDEFGKLELGGGSTGQGMHRALGFLQEYESRKERARTTDGGDEPSLLAQRLDALLAPMPLAAVPVSVSKGLANERRGSTGGPSQPRARPSTQTVNLERSPLLLAPSSSVSEDVEAAAEPSAAVAPSGVPERSQSSNARPDPTQRHLALAEGGIANLHLRTPKYRAVTAPTQPVSAFGQIALAYTRCEYEEVVQQSALALEREPKNAALHRIKGLAHGKLLQYDAAVVEASRSIALAPHNARGFLHRAEALAQLRRMPAAGESLISALQHTPLGQWTTRHREYHAVLGQVRRSRDYALVEKPLALSQSGLSTQQSRHADSAGSQPWTIHAVPAFPGSPVARRPKGEDRLVFDEERRWIQPELVESLDRIGSASSPRAELLPGQHARSALAPKPLFKIRAVHKQHLLLEMESPDDDRRDVHEAWISATVFEWSSRQQKLVQGKSDFRFAKITPVAHRLLRIDGLSSGTSYDLRVSALGPDGRPGQPAHVFLSTLAEETILPEHADIPESWRSIQPNESKEAARTSSSEASRRAAAMTSTRASLIEVLSRYRQWLVVAFRYSCLLSDFVSDSSAAKLLEVERTRTRMGKVNALSYKKIVLVLAPGPNIEGVKCLLVAARLHIEGASEIAAVICNGGGRKEVARDRAALAKAILNSQRLYDVPVGVGEPSGGPYTAQPHEYAYPGFAQVDQSKLREGQDVLAEVIAAAEPRSLTFVLVSALSDMAKLIRSNHERDLLNKALLVCTMGGCILTLPSGNARGDVIAAPDNAANNVLDMGAASIVYSWLVEKHVPLRVVGRDAICDVPMRIFTQMAEAFPTDPVMKYIRHGQEMGLIALWKRVCRGQVPNCDKRWFFDKFCGVAEAEFERRKFHSLAEGFPIERKLNGTVKPYDAVALVCALASEDSSMFSFRTAKQIADTYFFVKAEDMVPSAPFVEVFQQTMVAVARSQTAGFARFKPPRAESEGPLSRGVSMSGLVRFAHVYAQWLRLQPTHLRLQPTHLRKLTTSTHPIVAHARSCNLISAPALSERGVERSFRQTVRVQQVGRVSRQGEGDAEGDDADVAISEESIGMPEFIALMVRIVQASSIAQPHSLAQALEAMLLLVRSKLPLRPKAEDPFVHHVLNPRARAILVKWRPELRQMFETYREAATGSGDLVLRIPLLALLDLARDMQLPRSMSHEDVVFTFVQAIGDQEPVDERASPADDDQSLTFLEFQEWVSRVCHFQLRRAPSVAEHQSKLHSSNRFKHAIERSNLADLKAASVAESADVSGDDVREPEAPALSGSVKFGVFELVKQKKLMASLDPLEADLCIEQFGQFELGLDAWLDKVMMPAMRPAMRRRSHERDLKSRPAELAG